MESKTILETILDRGFTRRDFLKMCTVLAATMGLDFSETDKVVAAMVKVHVFQSFGYSFKIVQDVLNRLFDLHIQKWKACFLI